MCPFGMGHCRACTDHTAVAAPTAIADVPEPDEPGHAGSVLAARGGAGSPLRRPNRSVMQPAMSAMLMESDPGTAWVAGNRRATSTPRPPRWHATGSTYNQPRQRRTSESGHDLPLDQSQRHLSNQPSTPLSLLPAPASYNGIVAMGSLPNAVVLRGTVLVLQQRLASSSPRAARSGDRWSPPGVRLRPWPLHAVSGRRAAHQRQLEVWISMRPSWASGRGSASRPVWAGRSGPGTAD